MNEFEFRWSSIATSGHAAGRYRVSPDHVLDFYVQYSIGGERELAIEIRGFDAGDFELPAFKNITVVKVPLPDGTRVGLTLTNEGLARNFSVMCQDLAERTKAARTSRAAAGMLLAALDSWAELFRRREGDGLTENEALGLLGELVVVESLVLESTAGAAAIVGGWRGPEGDARDIGVGATRIEVKAQRATSANRLRISSLAQLDDRGQNVFLVAVRLSPGESGRSLAQVCGAVRGMLVNLPAALHAFERTITLSCMDPDAAVSRQPWVVDERLIYAVNDAFPRLTPANVGPGVLAVKYEVGGPAVDRCRMDWSDLLEAIDA